MYFMKNNQKLSKEESALIFGGVQGGGDEVTNKNGGNGCVCYYDDSCGVTNDNAADTTCKCLCSKFEASAV
jgi:hypothetical protein